MQNLFIKYLHDECSPEEVKELLGHFDFPENEIPLRGLIIDTLENTNADDEGSQWDVATDEMFAVIKKQLNAKKDKVVPFVRRTWFRLAAAVVIFAGGSAVYNSIKNAHQEQQLVKIETFKKEIGPGSNKAVLTLSDGSTISLETASHGTLARQGDTKIVKPVDGQLAYKSFNEKATEILFNSIATPRGGQYQLILSDGSKVWLNAASSLRFPANFTGHERKVELSGEGYFEVAKNAAMPFKVEIAGRGVVEVLGTHFNVNAYSDETTMKTTLLEGRVKVVVLATRDSHVLTPGEQAQLHRNGAISIYKNADTQEVIAWKNGAFNFNNANLRSVFRQLSRWYDVDIVFEGGVPEKQFNGEIQRDLKLPQVLKLLEGNNVFCRLEGKTLFVLK